MKRTSHFRFYRRMQKIEIILSTIVLIITITSFDSPPQNYGDGSYVPSRDQQSGESMQDQSILGKWRFKSNKTSNCSFAGFKDDYSEDDYIVITSNTWSWGHNSPVDIRFDGNQIFFLLKPNGTVTNIRTFTIEGNILKCTYSNGCDAIEIYERVDNSSESPVGYTDNQIKEEASGVSGRNDTKVDFALVERGQGVLTLAYHRTAATTNLLINWKDGPTGPRIATLQNIFEDIIKTLEISDPMIDINLGDVEEPALIIQIHSKANPNIKSDKFIIKREPGKDKW
jgi:hypothetical protein